MPHRAVAGGTCLITGAPGALAKTLLVKSIAQIFHLKIPVAVPVHDRPPAGGNIKGTENLQESTERARRIRTFCRRALFEI